LSQRKSGKGKKWSGSQIKRKKGGPSVRVLFKPIQTGRDKMGGVKTILGREREGNHTAHKTEQAKKTELIQGIIRRKAQG